MSSFHTEYFEETQRFAPWVHGAVFVGGAIAAFAAFSAASEEGLRVSDVAGLAALGVVFAVVAGMKLTTSLDSEGVRVKGFFFVNRMIPYTEIASAAARRYRPLLEYGGWGYRIGPSGKAYNARGNEGVQLVLKTGGRVLIGSGRAEELAAAVASRLG